MHVLSTYEAIEKCLDAVGRVVEGPDIPTLVIDAEPGDNYRQYWITVECLWDRWHPVDDAAKDVIEAALRTAVQVVSFGSTIDEDLIEIIKRSAVSVIKKAMKGNHLVKAAETPRRGETWRQGG